VLVESVIKDLDDWWAAARASLVPDERGQREADGVVAAGRVKQPGVQLSTLAG
jgi:hypothetical protein